MNSVFTRAHQVLMICDPTEKVEQTLQFADDWESGLTVSTSTQAIKVPLPGRPKRPELVPPKALKKRKISTTLGHQSMVHAIAHIEFNAINLALDAVYRFRQMPEAFYSDWIQVAKEEAYHFTLLQKRLQKLGVKYGDFPAHNGLWALAVETDQDVLVRMAIIPRVMEARGLDVTPGMTEKFKQIGDADMVKALDIIFQDEIGHVAVGSKWFHYCCAQRELDAEKTFFQLIQAAGLKGTIRGPYAEQARKQAGFSEQELCRLTQQNF